MRGGVLLCCGPQQLLFTRQYVCYKWWSAAYRSLDNNSTVGKRWSAAESWRSLNRVADNDGDGSTDTDNHHNGPSDNRPCTTAETGGARSPSNPRRRIATFIACRVSLWWTHRDVKLLANCPVVEAIYRPGKREIVHDLVWLSYRA